MFKKRKNGYLESTLKGLGDDTDLFTDSLCYMRKRFDALGAARRLIHNLKLRTITLNITNRCRIESITKDPGNFATTTHTLNITIRYLSFFTIKKLFWLRMIFHREYSKPKFNSVDVHSLISMKEVKRIFDELFQCQRMKKKRKVVFCLSDDNIFIINIICERIGWIDRIA